VEKLEWRGYQTVKKFDDTFIRFDMIHERDRQTDGRTPHDDMPRLHSSARQKPPSCFYANLKTLPLSREN